MVAESIDDINGQPSSDHTSDPERWSAAASFDYLSSPDMETYFGLVDDTSGKMTIEVENVSYI